VRNAVTMLVCLSFLVVGGAGAQADTGAVALAPCAKAPAAMACIPGGPFKRGVEKDPYAGYKRCYQLGRPRTVKSDAVPQATVSVSTFFMDKYEVTYGDFMACVKTGKCNTRPCVRAKKCNKKAGPRYRDFNRPKQPISGISWYAAVEYCRAMGKHLPTETQWEKAARGPDGDTHPWGNDTSTCERAVIRHPTKGRSCGIRKKGSSTIGRPLVVGSRPAGRYGLYDMIGNIEEWVADWYSMDWKTCGAACQGKDPKGPCDGADPCRGHRWKVVKGGSWYWPKCAATGYHRRPHYPRNQPSYHHFGFRCAASVDEAAKLVATGK
jgi:sulfatase modifying factor 1